MNFGHSSRYRRVSVARIPAADLLRDLRVFRNFGFSAAAMVSFVLRVGLFGSTFLVRLFVQQIQSFTPTNTKLLLMHPAWCWCWSFRFRAFSRTESRLAS